MRSMKQIADTLGVDKQRVYRFIKRNHIDGVRHESGTLMYDEAAESAIIKGLSESEADQSASEADRTTSRDAVIEALIKQLEVKDRQMEAKDEQITFLQNQLSAAQMLHAGTIQKQLTDGQGEAPDKSPGLFGRLFRRRD